MDSACSGESWSWRVGLGNVIPRKSLLLWQAVLVGHAVVGHYGQQHWCCGRQYYRYLWGSGSSRRGRRARDHARGRHHAGGGLGVELAAARSSCTQHNVSVAARHCVTRRTITPTRGSDRLGGDGGPVNGGEARLGSPARAVGGDRLGPLRRLLRQHWLLRRHWDTMRQWHAVGWCRVRWHEQAARTDLRPCRCRGCRVCGCAPLRASCRSGGRRDAQQRGPCCGW